MSSKFPLTLQGLVPPYFSFQHTHLVTLWFKISWWWLFISMIWHQRTSMALAVFFSWSPSLTRLPVVPLVACLPLPPLPWQAEWVPSASGSVTCLMASRSQFCGCLAGKPFPANTITRTVHRKFLSNHLPLPIIWPESGTFTSGMLRGQHYYCTWLAALSLEPDDLRSNPSSTTRCLIWQGTYSLEASASHLWSWQNNRLVWFKWINLLKHFRTMLDFLWELKY